MTLLKENNNNIKNKNNMKLLYIILEWEIKIKNTIFFIIKYYYHHHFSFLRIPGPQFPPLQKTFVHSLFDNLH